MNYVLFMYDHYSFPLAFQLKDEGHNVIVAMIEKAKDLKAPDVVDDETKREQEERLEVGDGMIDKMSQKDALELLRKVPDKEKSDYFFMFEHNDVYTIVKELLELGYTKGLFPTSFYFRLEREREFGKKVVEEFFDTVKVAEHFPFEKVADGIKHIEDSEEAVWVLKSNGNVGKTVVPKTDDPEVAKKLILDTLNKYKKEYEAGGFSLEKKIIKALEVSPSIVFWNGKPIYSVAGFESKEFGAGNIGVQKGGNLIASVVTPIDCKLNQIAFPEIIHKLAAKQPGLAIYDSGFMFDGKDLYFTEFCGMRYGYDGIFSEIALRDDGKPFVHAYFDDIANGRSPVKNKVGVAVRLFNIEGNAEQTKASKSDLPLVWDESIHNNLFLYRVKKHGEDVVSVGGMDFFGAMATGGDTLEEAVDKVYEMIDKIDFEKLYYRPKFDFLSTEYWNSIPNRIKAVKKYL